MLRRARQAAPDGAGRGFAADLNGSASVIASNLSSCLESVRRDNEKGNSLLEASQVRVCLLLATRGVVAGALALGLLDAPSTHAAAAEFHGKVVGVHDGDTISVMHDGRAERVRLEGIDCPEKGQAFSRRAKEATSELTFEREVWVEVRGTARYGRTIGRVFAQRTDLSLELVRRGLAWHFLRYSSEEALARAEAQARRARLGLWSEANAVPPWEWRKARHSAR